MTILERLKAQHLRIAAGLDAIEAPSIDLQNNHLRAAADIPPQYRTRLIDEGWLVWGTPSITGKKKIRPGPRVGTSLLALSPMVTAFTAQIGTTLGCLPSAVEALLADWGTTHVRELSLTLPDAALMLKLQICERYVGQSSRHRGLVEGGWATIESPLGVKVLTISPKLAAYVHLLQRDREAEIAERRDRRVARASEKRDGAMQIRRSIWNNILPADVAKAQIHWERRATARRMDSLGIKPAEIAIRLHVSSSSVASWLKEPAASRDKSPAEHYMSTSVDPELMHFVRRLANKRRRSLSG